MLLAPRPQGGFWAGRYRHGLFNFDSRQLVPVSPELANEGIRQLSSEPDGSVWIFTAQHAIFRFKDGRTLRLTRKNGLPCDTGSQIVSRQGSHWLYLPCGIAKIGDRELARWWTNPQYQMKMRVFDGFRPGYTQAVSQSERFIWSANGRTTQVVDTMQIAENKQPPPVALERLIVDHNEEPAVNGLKLGPSPSQVEIDYAGLSYLQLRREFFDLLFDELPLVP
jgi:hypothetical protein